MVSGSQGWRGPDFGNWRFSISSNRRPYTCWFLPPNLFRLAEILDCKPLPLRLRHSNPHRIHVGIENVSPVSGRLHELLVNVARTRALGDVLRQPGMAYS